MSLISDRSSEIHNGQRALASLAQERGYDLAGIALQVFETVDGPEGGLQVTWRSGKSTIEPFKAKPLSDDWRGPLAEIANRLFPPQGDPLFFFWLGHQGKPA